MSKNQSQISGNVFSFEGTNLNINQNMKYNLKKNINRFSIGEKYWGSILILYLKSYKCFPFASELKKQLNI